MKAIEKAKANGWEVSGSKIIATAVGNSKKDAECKLMILGFTDSGFLWESKDGELAIISRDGTITIS